MQKIKKIIKSFIKKDNIIYKILSKIYHKLSTIKYNITNRTEIRNRNKEFDKKANLAKEKIKTYNNEEYIVFYNPTWLGVAASTKGLFKNNVPLEHVYGKKIRKNLLAMMCRN